MSSERIALTGEAIADETQLDGRRHLTLELVDDSGSWSCALHLVLDIEGGAHEGEVELDGADDAYWQGTLTELVAAELEEELSLHAVFLSDSGQSFEMQLEETGAAEFAALVEIA